MNSNEAFLRWVELDKQRIPSYTDYPFNLGVIKQLDKLMLHPNVTYIVGENGTGKSTLMESIAVAWGFNPEGGTKTFHSQPGLLIPVCMNIFVWRVDFGNPGMGSFFGLRVITIWRLISRI